MMGVTLDPDLTILLDMPVEEGLARMSARSAPDRIEREKLDFFERARAAYLQRAAEAPDRVVVVDASGTLADVQATINVAMTPVLTSN